MLVPQTVLTAPERRLLGLLALGRTSTEAASALHPTPAETEALLADLLHRHKLASTHRLFVRALVYRWI